MRSNKIKCAMSYARYKELMYYCLRYSELPRASQKLIERLAKEAGGDIAKWLLQGVTSSVAYECLQVPCGRRQYYNRRRQFYELLDKHKQ